MVGLYSISTLYLYSIRIEIVSIKCDKEKEKLMNIIKRAWINISRSKPKTLILLLLVFILANVLFTTLSVTMSLKKTKETVLSQLAPIVKIGPDYDKINNEKDFPEMPVEKADALYEKAKNMVKTYDYNTGYSLETNKGTNLVKLPNEESNENADSVTDVADSNYIYTIGTQLNQTNLAEKKEGKLISGNGFNDSDIKEGSPKAIITKQFAETNNLSVGDTLKLTQNIVDSNGSMDAENSKPIKTFEYEFEIVGIMQINSIDEYIASGGKNKDDNMVYYTNQDKANSIYVPNAMNLKMINEQVSVIKELHPDEKELWAYDRIIEPNYILKDMKDLESFKSMAKTVYANQYVTATSISDAYDTAAKPLTSMEKLLNLIFIITVLASVVILSLVLCIFMYLRQKEMGIFLALGERKTRLVGQLLLETVFVALVGATIALITATVFSNILADNTLQSLLQQASGAGAMDYDSAISPELISQQYKGGFSLITIIGFYGVLAGTIIISQVATTLYLLRLNPKKILM